MLNNIKLIVLGIFAGILGGLLGIGGGTIIVPMLIIICSMPQKKAQGTSLFCAMLIAISGIYPYTFHGNINYIYGIFISLGAIIGAIIGSYIMKRTDTKILRNIFVCLLIYVSINMIYTGIKQTDMIIYSFDLSKEWIVWSVLFTIGIITGTLSGLLGIGGGLIMVPSMLILGFGQKMAQGISLLCMIPTAFTGIISQAKAQNVDFKAGIIIGGSSVIFSFLGANLISIINENHLKIGFGLFMLFVSYMMSRTKGK